MGNNNTRWKRIEEWSPTLFLVAGVVLMFYGAFNGIEAFTDVAVPANIFEPGYVFGFFGLLGLYPAVSKEQPLLARTGLVTGAVGLLGAVLVSLRSFGHFAGLVPEYPAGWWAVILLMLIGFIGGFLSLGLAVLRSETYSRTAGLALLAPGVIVIVMLLHIVAGLDRPATAFVISSGQAMAHLAIGATLRQQSSQPERDEVADEPAAGVATDD